MHTVVLSGIVSGLVLLALGCSSPELEPKGDKLFPPQAARWNDYQGQSVDLRDYEGKIVLVNFWATWCGPCRYEIPALVEMSAEYDPEQVAIIGISIDQGPAERVLPLIGEFVERLAINYPVVHDGQHELLRAFYKKSLRRMGVPLTFIFDREGRVYKMHLGVPRDRSGRPNPRGVFGEDIEALLARS